MTFTQRWPDLIKSGCLLLCVLALSLSLRTQAADTVNTLFLTQAEQTYLDQRNRTLTFCAHNDWMPLQGVSENGKHEGMASGLLNHLSEQLSIQFDLYEASHWAAALTALQTDKCDLLPTIPASPVLQQDPEILLTQAYYTLPTVVLGRLESPFISSLADLHNKPVGISSHTGLISDMRLRHPELTLVKRNSEREALQDVQSGKLYGYIGTLATTSLLLQEMELNDIRVIGRVPMDTFLTIAIDEDATVLAGILDKILTNLNEDGNSQITREWLTIQIEEKIDYTLLWQTLGGALVLFALLVYWNRKLRILNRELEAANQKLAQISATDQLTGVGNRTLLEREFARSFAASQRASEPYLVAMIDVDHFKIVNDQWGHEAGDECLKILARTLKSHFQRISDHVVRYGGEEFIVFCTMSNAQETASLLHALRDKVANTPIVFENTLINLTVSIGYCLETPLPRQEADEWFRAADRALYSAKQSGRNTVMTQSPEPSENGEIGAS